MKIHKTKSHQLGTVPSASTEGADLIKIIILGNGGYFIERQDINSLIWQNNERILTIHANLKQDELIKIAESIKLQEK